MLQAPHKKNVFFTHKKKMLQSLFCMYTAYEPHKTVRLIRKLYLEISAVNTLKF
jgi:hypothetical protein